MWTSDDRITRLEKDLENLHAKLSWIINKGYRNYMREVLYQIGRKTFELLSEVEK